MSEILTFSGWGQPAASLEITCPVNARHFAYSAFDCAERVFDQLSAFASPEIVVGWSLGGQLAVRAIAAGVIKPKKLVLLGAPFCFVSKAEGDGGVPPMMAEQISEMYNKDPQAMVANLQALIAHGDSKEREIRKAITIPIRDENIQHWRRWLDELIEYDASKLELDLDSFPQTHLIHGKQDAVIYAKQAERWKHLIPQASLHILDQCGHAPHLHDPELVKSLLEK